MDSDAPREAMTLALGGLPDRARRADELRIVEELGYAEIAPRLGCTDGAARTSVHRGLARLNRLMATRA